MPDTLMRMQFSLAHVVVAVLGMLLALALSRVAIGRLHRRRVLIIIVALALSLLLHIANTVVYGGEPSGLNAGAVLLLAFGLTGLLGLMVFDLGFRRARLDVPTILRDILQAAVFFIILLVVLRRSGVNLLSLVTTSAVLTAVIGLALQNTIANMFAGLSLQLDRTVNVGDWIQMSKWIGRITHIKWRSTFIVTRDGNNVILPNSELLRQEVLNFSKPSAVHRSTVQVGIAYRHPPREVTRVLVAALRGMPEVLSEPAPDCLPVEFGDSAIVYALRYWTDTIQRDVLIEGEVRVRIWYAAQRAGLEIPFPSRTIHTVPAMATARSDAGDEREQRERLEALARVDLFARLDPAELAILVGSMKSQSFASGELIIEQGDVGDSLYVVHRGEVAVSLGVDGVTRDVALLKAGSFLGEMSLMTGEPRTATCRAHTDVECWVIDHEAMRRLLASKPKIAEDMSALLAARQTALDGKKTVAAAKPDVPPQAARMLDRIRAFFSL